jgi:crossover junction endodeoxyribonuclease RuvC
LTASNEFRILGIGPGLNTTGYGVLTREGNEPILLEAGVVRSRRTDPLPQRLRSIHDGIHEVITSLKPTAVALEELYSHYERPTTALLMGHARGVICLAVGGYGLTPHHYAATQVKKIVTGNGRASKMQVQLTVMRQLKLTHVPEPADVADALAIAICHFYLDRIPASLS